MACLQGNAHLVKIGKGGGGGGVNNGFWGAKMRGNLMVCNKDLIKSSSFLRSEFGKGGIGYVSSVPIPDHHLTKKAMTHPGSSVLPNKTADPNSVASVILGRGYEIDPKGGPPSRESFRAWAAQLKSERHTTVRRRNQVAISSCINSGINEIFILTQITFAVYNKNPDLRKLDRPYKFFREFKDECIELLAATTQAQEEIPRKYFHGTTDALDYITWDAKNKNIEHVMVLSGDHLYGTDYMDFVQKHIDTGADISVVCKFVDDSLASDYGLLKIDSSGRITHFVENPKGSDLKTMQVDTSVLGLSPEQAIRYLYIASTGTYVFRTDVLLKLVMARLNSCSIDIDSETILLPCYVDFASKVIPSALTDHNAQVSKVILI